MSEIHPLSQSEKDFLGPYLPNAANKETPPNLPFVTLTYATSLDGMISLGPGLRTTLSGPETKSMTHYLRLHHDAILIGAGTAVADKPSLNCRYPGVSLDTQPMPVVVDPRGRWEVRGSVVERLASDGRGKGVWVFREKGGAEGEDGDGAMGDRRIEMDRGEGGGFEWRGIFERLKGEGMGSVMVEGGATVINQLLAEPGLVDAVIVTIAPTWLGQGGVAACPPDVERGGERVNAARLGETKWRQFGADAVLCGRLGG